MLKDRQFRLARIWSNKQLMEICPLFTGSVVNVSAGDDVDKEGKHYRDYFNNATEYHTTNFKPGSFRGHKGRANEHLIDLEDKLPVDLKNKFNVALSHTVLEHVFNVNLAFANTADLTNDILITIVPFAQVQHECESFKDYWRFTPTCLSMMYATQSMEVIYQSWNQTPNASVYILTVGSRQPEKWKNRFNNLRPDKLPADWIGNSGLIQGTLLKKARSSARFLLNRLHSFRTPTNNVSKSIKKSA